MTDLELMQTIKTKWGALLTQVTQTETIPPAFLAALTANESAGNAGASRYEPRVLGDLAEVVLAIKPTYGSITTAQLAGASLEYLHDLATSFGLVQIMGYEVLFFETPNGVGDLKNPVTELPIACRMLADFRRRFAIEETDYGPLFDCWNTGRPHAPTADPKYIPNGLARMTLYESL